MSDLKEKFETDGCLVVPDFLTGEEVENALADAYAVYANLEPGSNLDHEEKDFFESYSVRTNLSRLGDRPHLLSIGDKPELGALAGELIINLLTDLQDVRETAIRYLPWMIASPVISVWSFLYDGVYVGATRAKAMRNIMVFSTIAIFLPAWYLLQPLGNDGLWLAFLLFMASRGIGMHVGYRKQIVRGTFGPDVAQ